MRTNGPDLWFWVTLANPPLGEKLALECVWIDPAGTVAHRNRYETKVVDHAPWLTHAHYALKSDAATGQWTVRLYQADRELISCQFEVRDSAAAAPASELPEEKLK